MNVDWIAQEIVSDYHCASVEGYRCAVILSDHNTPWVYTIIASDNTLVSAGLKKSQDEAFKHCEDFLKERGAI